jgi:DeoR/GlpR family transcriptional regulator of sugar metabolism
MTNAKKNFSRRTMELIYKVIQEKQKVFVPELAKQFNISESSVRLDLLN